MLYSDLLARKEIAYPEPTGSFLKFTVSKSPSTSPAASNIMNFSYVPEKLTAYECPLITPS